MIFKSSRGEMGALPKSKSYRGHRQADSKGFAEPNMTSVTILIRLFWG
jgi:hypothetical protein